MTNFSDMLSKAKAMQEMKEAQDQIKKLKSRVRLRKPCKSKIVRRLRVKIYFHK